MSLFFNAIMRYTMNQFIDNPNEVQKVLDSFSDAEERAFNFGYMIALVSLVEQLRDSKIKLLNKVHDIEDVEEEVDEEDIENKARLQLMSRLRILDIYDEHYSKRIDQIAPGLALSP